MTKRRATCSRKRARGFQAAGDEANQAVTSMNLAFLELYVRDFEAAYIAAASVLEKVRANRRRLQGHRRSHRARLRRPRARSPSRGERSVCGVARSHPRRGYAIQRPPGHAHRNRACSRRAQRPFGRAASRSRPSAERRRGVCSEPRWLELEAVLARPLTDALRADEYARELSIGAALDHEEAITLAQSLLGRPSDIP